MVWKRNTCAKNKQLLPTATEQDDSHDNTYAIPMQPLMPDHAICVLELNSCAENRHVIHNASDVDELKLMSSLNTLGYIEFDVLCNLKYSEEKLYTYANLPWFARHTYHVFGNYNNKLINCVISIVIYDLLPSLDQFFDAVSSKIDRPRLEEVVEPIVKVLIVFKAYAAYMVRQ